jgi:hypothetical protein
MTADKNRNLKVFISYSHDSDEHKERVREFCNWLRTQGVECSIDADIQSPAGPPQGWPHWMQERIDWADFVLVVFSESYRRRFDGKEAQGVGLGAAWEAALITQDLYDTGQNTKFLPVVFSSTDKKHIPPPLKRWNLYDLSQAAERKDLHDKMLGEIRRALDRRERKLVLFHETGGTREDQWLPNAGTKEEALNQLWHIAKRSFEADALIGRPITSDKLRQSSCLILTIGPRRTTHFDDHEIKAIQKHVLDSKGLLLLGTHFGDRHHLANLSTLAQTYGLYFNEDTLMAKPSQEEGARWRHGPSADPSKEAVDLRPAQAASSPHARKIQETILKDVVKVRTIDACSLDVRAGGVPLLEFRDTSELFAVHYRDQVTGYISRCERLDRSFGDAMAASTTSKVVAVGGWRTFMNEFMNDPECDNRRLAMNTLYWLCHSESDS